MGIAFSISTNPVGIHVSNCSNLYSLKLSGVQLQLPIGQFTPSPFRSCLSIDSKSFNISLVPSNGWPPPLAPTLPLSPLFFTKCSINPSVEHLNHCKHIHHYLKGKVDLGISFCADQNQTLYSYIHFPISDNSLTGLSDANWDPQDQSQPKQPSSKPLPIFKSRSMSGYPQWLNSLLHWQSKRQTITARTTAEAEIYATDE